MSRDRIRTGSGPLLVLLGAFGVFGTMFGVWQVLLADLSRALQLSPGPLGAALSAGFVASLPAMVVGGRAADRWGNASLVLAAGFALGASFLGFTFVSSYAVLVVLLLAFFAASGVYDVGINAAAMATEQASKRRVIAYLHAAFSAGGVVGALAAGTLISVGVSFRSLYLGVALLTWTFLISVWRRGLGPRPERSDKELSASFGLYREPVILLLALITALAFLSEGAMENWSAIYLRSALSLPALVGASGVAVFHAAMMIGRLLSGGVARRFGRLTTLRVAGLAAAAGMSVGLATDAVPVVLFGFLVVGLALSAVAPVSFSLAGDLAPGRAGQVSSIITTIGYGGFLVGPSLVGGLAELTSLRVGLAAIILAGVLIVALSTALRVSR